MDLNEARKQLDACLSEEMKREYFAILRKWLIFSKSITKEIFDSSVRKLLTTDEQIRCHNNFFLAILAKCKSTNKPKSTRTSNEKGGFENIDYVDYILPHSPLTAVPPDIENHSAATELFMPDSNFIACRVAIIAWENGMKGASDKVTDLMVHACQVFVKNIITAMITRKKGFKVKNKIFQFGFNTPIPNPFIRNVNNIIDDTMESNVDVFDGEDSFRPKCKSSLDIAEQKAAFAYSCARKKVPDNYLTVKLLYDTLRANPGILGQHSLQSTEMFKLSLQIADEDT